MGEIPNMLMGKRSRHYVRHELTLKPPRLKGFALPFISADDTQDVSSILLDAIEKGIASYEVKQNDTVRITGLDIRPADDMAIILIRRRDEDAATQVFENGNTGDLWKPDVEPEQAPAISAHLFIRLTPSGGPYPCHRVILEEIPGLGRTYIQYILQKVLAPFEYEYMDEKGKVKSTYTIPTISGIPSATLGEALRGGGIKYVELVRPAQLDGLDMTGLVSHPQRMRLSVRSDQNPLDMIARVRDWAVAHDWQNVRVQVETSDDRTKVVEISREADAADVLFIRSEVVNTRGLIDVCTDTINEELTSLAKARLLSDDDW